MGESKILIDTWTILYRSYHLSGIGQIRWQLSNQIGGVIRDILDIEQFLQNRTLVGVNIGRMNWIAVRDSCNDSCAILDVLLSDFGVWYVKFRMFKCQGHQFVTVSHQFLSKEDKFFKKICYIL